MAEPEDPSKEFVRAYLDTMTWRYRSSIGLEPQEDPEDLSRDIRDKVEAILFDAWARGSRPQEIEERGL